MESRAFALSCIPRLLKQSLTKLPSLAFSFSCRVGCRASTLKWAFLTPSLGCSPQLLLPAGPSLSASCPWVWFPALHSGTTAPGSSLIEQTSLYHCPKGCGQCQARQCVLGLGQPPSTASLVHGPAWPPCVSRFLPTFSGTVESNSASHRAVALAFF